MHSLLVNNINIIIIAIILRPTRQTAKQAYTRSIVNDYYYSITNLTKYYLIHTCNGELREMYIYYQK